MVAMLRRPLALAPALLLLVLLSGCASAAADPERGVAPSASPSATAEPVSIRPADRMGLACDALVPGAHELGFGEAEVDGVVDFEAATRMQSGSIGCTWSMPASPGSSLAVVAIPDGPSPVETECGLLPVGPSCNGVRIVNAVSVYVALTFVDAAMSEADAMLASEQVFTSVEASLAGVDLATPVRADRTVASGGLASIAFGSVSPWFGLQVDEGVTASLPQEMLGDSVFHLAHAESAAWGSYDGNPGVQADLLPGGAWAASELPGARPSSAQRQSAFTPTAVVGLEDAVMEVRGQVVVVCGALGLDLLCVTSWELEPDAVTSGTASLVAALAAA
jgi:hypothetical protein